jgi:hypothetical protein
MISMMISSGAPRSPNIVPSFVTNLSQPRENGYLCSKMLIFR